MSDDNKPIGRIWGIPIKHVKKWLGDDAAAKPIIIAANPSWEIRRRYTVLSKDRICPQCNHQINNISAAGFVRTGSGGNAYIEMTCKQCGNEFNATITFEGEYNEDETR